METLEINELAHRVYNEASPNTPIVLLHGLMGYASNWGKIWPKLAEDRPVLVYDQRGHGRSAKPLKGYSPSDYANDLHGLVEHYGWKKVHLCGHSMGGRVAIHFAATYPNLVATLVLEDSGAFGSPGALNWIENLLGRVPVPFASRDAAREFFDREFTDDPLVGSFLHANIERKENSVYDWRFSKSAMIETIEHGRSRDASDEFQRINCPILVIHGELSTHLTPAEIERMRVLNPENFQHITIKGAGHFVHPTKPEEFIRQLVKFIEP